MAGRGKEASVDLVQVQTEIEVLNAHCTTSSTRCTGVAPVKLFETEFVKLDITLENHIIATLLCGRIFKDKNQDRALIIPLSGTDLDSKINCYSWSKDDSKWKILRSQHLPGV
eukprot:10357224-Ditylum_brightwellii.AAC.1